MCKFVGAILGTICGGACGFFLWVLILGILVEANIIHMTSPSPSEHQETISTSWQFIIVWSSFVVLVVGAACLFAFLLGCLLDRVLDKRSVQSWDS